VAETPRPSGCWSNRHDVNGESPGGAFLISREKFL